MKLKKMLAAVLTMAMVATALPVTAMAAGEECTGECTHVAAIGDTHYADLHDALSFAGAAGAGSNTIEILVGTIDLSSANWTPVTVDGYHGADIVTVEGNDCVITGLNAPLFSGGFAGGSGIVITDLTIKDSEIISSNTQGSGAFIECVDSMDVITLDNCHLIDSTLTGSRTGGLVGWTSGYNNTNDGPVETYVTITDCSVIGCTITGTSVGAINGHAGANAWTFTTIENCTVEGTNLYSNDDGDWRVGVVVGTANVGEVTINNISYNDIDMKQTAAPIEGQTDLVGRFVPGTTGKLTIDGVEYDSDCKPVEYVAKTGGESYKSLQEAIWEAEEDATVTLLMSVDGEGIVIEKDVVIDLGGNTYNLIDNPVGSAGTETLGFQLLAGDNKADPCDVTIKNGTISVDTTNADNEYFKVLLMNYCDLKLEDVTLDGTNLVADKWVMGNNNGNTVITGDTYLIAPEEDGTAFDVDDMANNGYPNVSVTFDKDFTGGVKGAFYFYDSNSEDVAALNIAGGYFTQDPSAYVVAGKQAVETTANGYSYMIVEKEIASTDVETTVIPPTATVEGANKVDADAVEDAKQAVDIEALTTAGTATATSKETTDAAIDALADAGETIPEGETVTIIVEPKLEMKVEDVSATEVKVEIKALCDISAQVGEDETTNVTVAENQPMDTKGTEVEVTIPLPEDFAEAGKEITVYHFKDGKLVGTHTATVNDNNTATFTNDLGFSTFVVSMGDAVAEDGNSVYSSLQEAVNNAAPGATITMMGNVTGPGAKINKNVTINFGGYTYSLTTGVGSGDKTSNGLQILQGNTVKLMNGTLEVADGYENNFYILVQNYADLTVEDMILDGTNLDKYSGTDGDSYTMSNNHGNVTITGDTTIIANNDGDKAFAVDVCDYSTYDGVTVTFDSNFRGKVKGKIDVTDSNKTDDDALKLNIAGTGEFTSIPAMESDVEGEISISGGTFAVDVPVDMMADNTNKITLADGSNEIITDDDLENGIVTLEAGEKLEAKEGDSLTTLLAVTQGSATYENGDIIAEAGTVLTTPDNGTVSFPYGGTIDDGNVNVNLAPSASSSKKSSKKYSVSIDKDDIENGTVKLSSTSAKKGATVTITVTPDEGYELDELTVLDKDGNKVELTDKGNGKFTFKMPRGGVEIVASFEEGEGTPAAPAERESLVLTINQLFYLLNGTYEANDVAPIIKGDRTFLPIRLIAEFLGATVTWNEAEQSVTIVKGDTTIVIYIGQEFALVNGEPVQLDEAAFIANDRTYLPLRFIAENLGGEVVWDGVNNTVTIYK